MTQQPTLAHVPGIIARTLLRTVARAIFAIAGVLLLLGLGVGFVGVFLCTWRTPRTHRMQLLANLVVSAAELVKTYRQ